MRDRAGCSKSVVARPGYETGRVGWNVRVRVPRERNDVNTATVARPTTVKAMTKTEMGPCHLCSRSRISKSEQLLMFWMVTGDITSTGGSLQVVSLQIPAELASDFVRTM